jgi:hypothetical protein
VAFASYAAGLVPDDLNGARDVFVRDLQLGTTELVSPATAVDSDGGGNAPSISDDGRYVAYISADPGGHMRAFLRDRALGTTQIASLDAAGQPALASQVEISGDGTTVAFDELRLSPTQPTAALVVRRLAGGQLSEVVGDADGIAVGNLSDDGDLVGFAGPYPAAMSGSWSPRILDSRSGTHELAAVNLTGGAPQLGTSGPAFVSGAGTHATFVSRASDLVVDDVNSGLDVFRTSLIDDADGVTRNVPAGGSVSTGTTATPADPIETAVATPVGGTVTITESDEGSAPSGYSVLGQQVQIEAPQASAGAPLRLTFLLDASLVPAAGADTVALFRDGVEATQCAVDDGTATPDPCVAQRQVLPDGDLIITVLSSHASTWTLARVAQPYVFAGFFPPVDNAPTVNTTRAGGAVPVAFSLGRDAGLGIFAANSPSSRTVS